MKPEDHFHALADLATSLGEYGIEVYAHNWDGRAFGSWQLVAGFEGKKYEFDWNGGEGIMNLTALITVPAMPGFESPVILRPTKLGVEDEEAPFRYVRQHFRDPRSKALKR